MNMKKWIAAALACSALALSACGGQSKDASSSAPKADKVYRVAANAEFAPFESLDSAGNVEGFDVDLMNAMAKPATSKSNSNTSLGTASSPRSKTAIRISSSPA